MTYSSVEAASLFCCVRVSKTHSSNIFICVSLKYLTHCQIFGYHKNMELSDLKTES